MGASEKLEAVVREQLEPWLDAVGFRRRGSACFVRECDGGWQVIELTKNKWSTREHIEFLVDLGVALALLSDGDEEWRQRGWPREWECHLRHRIVGAKNEWITVGRFTGRRRLAARVLAGVKSVGLPWLDLYTDPPRLLREIATNPAALEIYDPEPVLALARAAGTAEQVAAVERAIDLATERWRCMEERAGSWAGGKSPAAD